MQIPTAPYVALYGTHCGDWRERAVALLESRSIPWYDPTDAGWDGIDESNGDARQAEIDALVAKEHLALNGARCVIFHIERREIRDGEPTGATTMSLATRCELGFLAGRKLRTFVHIEPDVVGRNYLWSVVALYPASMVRCATLDAAVEGAIQFMQQR